MLGAMNQHVFVRRLLLLLMCKYQWEVIKTGCLIALTGFFSARPVARISNDTSIAMSLPSTAAPASSSSLAVLSYTVTVVVFSFASPVNGWSRWAQRKPN